MNKEEIAAKLLRGLSELTNLLKDAKTENFNVQTNGKWSAAENLDHLIKSNKAFLKGLSAPKLTLQFMFGKSKNGSRNYDELIEFYQSKLEDLGPITNTDYSPSNKYTLEQSLPIWNSFEAEYRNHLNTWTEDELDKHVLPHPLLGKLTVRELLYFTVFHNKHHLKTIENLVLNEAL